MKIIFSTRFVIHDISELELARQLTLVDFEIFRKIKVRWLSSFRLIHASRHLSFTAAIRTVKSSVVKASSPTQSAQCDAPHRAIQQSALDHQLFLACALAQQQELCVCVRACA
jgi:hypothetical protein